VLAVAAHGLDGVRHVAQVVEGVEDAEHVHAVFGRTVDEAVHHRVFVVAVAQQVLPTQQHLQARIGHQRAEGSQALPRVFVQEADAGVEGGAAPAFHRPVAGGVDVGAGGTMSSMAMRVASRLWWASAQGEIARAVVKNPTLLLADEPTGNLDPTTSLGIVSLLDDINGRGTTVVMATHDDEIVNQLRRRVIELDDGAVVRDQARGVYGGGQR
jgi:hypothetical protein